MVKICFSGKLIKFQVKGLINLFLDFDLEVGYFGLKIFFKVYFVR